MFKSRSLPARVFVALAALTIVAGAAQPATAVQTTALGTQNCRSGERVYVKFNLVNSATYRLWVNGRYRGSYTESRGATVFDNLNVQSANWKIESSGGLSNVVDGCTSFGDVGGGSFSHDI